MSTKAPEPVVKDFYALRSFRFSDDYGVLHGYFYSQIVLDGINAAACTVNKTHKAPVEDCSCGFYAYDQTLAVPDRNVQGDIQAVVRLSGKIIPCERGIKAARMEIVALSWPTATPEQVATVQQNYPSVVWCDTVEDMCARFPLADFPRGVERAASSSGLSAWLAATRRGVGAWRRDPLSALLMVSVVWVVVVSALFMVSRSHGTVLHVVGVMMSVGGGGMLLASLGMLVRTMWVVWRLWREHREEVDNDSDSGDGIVAGSLAVMQRNLSNRFAIGVPRTVLVAPRMARVGVVPAGVPVMDVSDAERG